MGSSLFLDFNELIKFKSKEEIYQFIEKYGNVTIIRDVEKTNEQPQPVKLTPPQQKEADSIKQAQNKLLYEQRKKNSDAYMEQRMKIMNEQEQKKKQGNQPQ